MTTFCARCQFPIAGWSRLVIVKERRPAAETNVVGWFERRFWLCEECAATSDRERMMMS